MTPEPGKTTTPIALRFPASRPNIGLYICKPSHPISSALLRERSRRSPNNMTLCADFVAKQFCSSERARLIKNRPLMRNLDFKDLFASIRSLRIFIPQLLRGDFCNKICQKAMFGLIGGRKQGWHGEDASSGRRRAHLRRPRLRECQRSSILISNVPTRFCSFRGDPHLYRFHPPLLFECGVPMYGNSVRMSVWGFRPVGGH